jgi:adenine-specific DNA-methyltransferase
MGIQTTENAGKELKTLFGKEVFAYPKSESLIEYLINIVSNKLLPSDYILDYHLGSGTTAAVAHKLGYKYIGIEQMDYIQTVTIERLKKVINGEQGGISQAVEWQGGGSFVYAELLQYNQLYIDKLQDATTKKEVVKVWQEMEAGAFISVSFDKAMFNERLDAFQTTTLDNMKHYLMEVLDKNQLYLNYSEINDKTFAVSKEDISLNNAFYKKGKRK